MKKLSLHEIQTISLDILKDVHAFCVANHIRYSVAYGSLIGVFRHQGFIPWDDDIDIVMPRQDYDCFIKSYHSNDYKLVCQENDKTCCLAFARVCDYKSTIQKTIVPWCKQDVGVSIDVFPLDGVPDNESFFKRIHKLYCVLWSLSVRFRGGLASFKDCDNIQSCLKLIVKKMIYLNGAPSKFLTRLLIKGARRIPFGLTDHFSQLTCLDGYEYHEIFSFDSTSLMPYEDTKIMVMNGYDDILKKCYGNYMELPEEKDRVGHALNMTTFYWK